MRIAILKGEAEMARQLSIDSLDMEPDVVLLRPITLAFFVGHSGHRNTALQCLRLCRV